MPSFRERLYPPRLPGMNMNLVSNKFPQHVRLQLQQARTASDPKQQFKLYVDCYKGLFLGSEPWTPPIPQPHFLRGWAILAREDHERPVMDTLAIAKQCGA
jgi:hypothetical protein